MPSKEFSGFDCRQESLQLRGRPIERLNESRDALCALGAKGWSHKAGIDVNLVRRYDGKDWRSAVVPERAVKSYDLGVVDPLDLLEVDQRRAIGAKHAIEPEEVKRAARDVRPGRFRRRVFKVGIRREKKVTMFGEPELLLPLFPVLLHDSTPARVGPLSQPLVHDTKA